MRPGENGAKAAAVERALAQEREPALPPCKCGCGQTVRKAGQRYVFGHQHKGGSKGKGFAFSAHEVERRLAQECLTACALCEWRFWGSVREGHRAFLAHMAATHRKRAA
jgi:hypothetical protein